jgi:3-oxoadipate enol-lactonase
MTAGDVTFTTTDGVRLHSRRDGQAPGTSPRLLVINSLGTDLRSWDRAVAIWGEHLDILRYDQRGHGASGTGTPGADLHRLGRDALAVLDHHGVERAHVCGCSLGGLVAQWLAVEAPERVEGLVLVDTAMRVGSEEAWRDRAALVRDGGMEAVVPLVLERFFSDEARATNRSGVAQVARVLLNLDPEGYAQACEVLATADLREIAGAIQASTLVVVGEKDVATPPHQALELAKVTGAALEVLPGAGHLAGVEQPEALGRLVLEHLGVRPDTTG